MRATRAYWLSAREERRISNPKTYEQTRLSFRSANGDPTLLHTLGVALAAGGRALYCRPGFTLAVKGVGEERRAPRSRRGVAHKHPVYPEPNNLIVMVSAALSPRPGVAAALLSAAVQCRGEGRTPWLAAARSRRVSVASFLF